MSQTYRGNKPRSRPLPAVSFASLTTSIKNPKQTQPGLHFWMEYLQNFVSQFCVPYHEIAPYLSILPAQKIKRSSFKPVHPTDI